VRWIRRSPGHVRRAIRAACAGMTLHGCRVSTSDAVMPSFLRPPPMPETLIYILLLIAIIIVYVVAKVVFYVRRSEEQWKEVDKSKLKEWDDDDDW
jgi:hypothetical protein